jgi:hypothetical protein
MSQLMMDPTGNLWRQRQEIAVSMISMIELFCGSTVEQRQNACYPKKLVELAQLRVSPKSPLPYSYRGNVISFAISLDV